MTDRHFDSRENTATWAELPAVVKEENQMKTLLWRVLLCLLSSYLLFFPNVQAQEKKESRQRPRPLASATILFENGKTLEVSAPQVKVRSNPQYIPALYQSAEEFVFKRTIRTMGVETVDSKQLQLSELRSVEYVRDRLNECICLLTLQDGRRVLASRSARVHKERLPKEFLTIDVPFEGYNPSEYQLEGVVEGKQFRTSFGEFFGCFGVEDAGSFVDIKKITFNWRP